MASVRTYITETEFAKIDNPQSSTTYIVLDDNDPTLVKKVVFKTNNINNEGEVYIVQDEYPTPSGAVEITANANNIDVKQYATANVNVPNPSTGTLNITANDDYDVTEYAGVSVNVPNPSTGTLEITSNNTYDVTDYAGVSVNVPNPSTGTLNITANDDYDVTDYAGVSVNVPNPSTGTLVITSNDTFDVTNYASVDVNVETQKTCSFKFNSDGQFQFNKHGNGKYYLKKNEGEWTEYTTSQTVSVVNGDIIELKSDLTPINIGNYDQILSFRSSVSFEVEGDILGAIFGNVLSNGGCFSMFSGCTGLTKVPNDMFAKYTYMPARACERMFYDCTSLTTAPELPATKLSANCYSNMFSGCTSLTTAPELPATTLARSCYEAMFNGCSLLNYVKCLATNLSATGCTTNWLQGVAATGTFVKYSLMENWPTGASGIPTGWTVQNEGPHNYRYDYLTFEATDSTSFTWTDSANNNSIEYSLDDGTTWTTLTSGSSTPVVNNGDKVIFRGSNLTIDNYNTGIGKFSSSGQFNVSGNIMSLIYGDNFINQTTLTGVSQFSSLFEGCTNLINANNLILPVTTLTEYCYSSMFKGCTSLTTIPELPAETLALGCYSSMFKECTSLTTAPELPAETLASDCYNSMFKGCSSLTTAPELLAYTLESSCYMSMFEGCSSLTTAPELPAYTIIYNCYNSMFKGCTSLNYVRCLATYNDSGTSAWLDGVSETGTFIKAATMSDWTTGESGIPSGWTVEDDA